MLLYILEKVEEKQNRTEQSPVLAILKKLSPCGPISFLRLSLKRCYLGYLLEHYNLPH